LECNESSDFFLFKILRAHILPLTNCAFNKSGDKFITGSYDRTCKVWNTLSGDELLTLEGHRNVVYAIAFNNPYGDKIITGSFGKIALPISAYRIIMSIVLIVVVNSCAT
jgi:dynein assembly factor with WDR repeat domains 1